MLGRPWRKWSMRGLQFLAVPGAVFAVFHLLASAQSNREEALGMKVCRHGDLDRGGSRTIDLREVGRNYDGMKTKLTRAVTRYRSKVSMRLKIRHDSGLPRCWGKKKRRVKLAYALPLRFRSRAFYFIRIDSRGDRVPWRGEIAKNRRAEVLLLKVSKPTHAGWMAKQLKRSVTFATKELAGALGVRCGSTKVTVGENGHELVILETP